MGRYSSETTRPAEFTLNPHAPLARGLVFAGLGRIKGTTRYHDSSCYGNHGTLTLMDPPSDWVWDSTLNRWLIACDGSNDYVRTASLPGIGVSGGWTLSAWIKHTGSSAWAAIAIGDGASYPHGAVLPARLGKVQTYVPNAYRDSGVATPSGWFHVSLAIASASAGSLYINSVPYSSNPTVDAIGGPALSIGRFANLAFYYDGQVADAIVHNRILSPSEIQQLADPSNVMLSGLILPPRRRWWPVVSGEVPPATFKAFWAGRRSQVISGGVS
jgi:hypothetical protein